MRQRRSDGSRLWRAATGLVAVGTILGAGVWAYGTPEIPATISKVTVSTLGDLVKDNPLPANKTAQVSWKSRVGNSGLHVVEASTIRLHHHTQQDHLVYVARGRGTARLWDQIRQVKAGDILNIPKGIPYGFTSKGKENLILLVVAENGWNGLGAVRFEQ